LAAWENNLKNESTAAGKKRVLEYFAEISFPTNPAKNVPPWCGAFVAHCILASPAPDNRLVVKGPARAANWIGFGNVAIPLGDPKPPQGAVVVLSPDRGSARSGHVAFFDRYSGSSDVQVMLLGGNQSDSTNVKKFARSKIRTIRWDSSQKQADDDAAKKEEDDAAGQVGELSSGKMAPLLDFIGAHESRNNYNAYFRHANNTNNPKLTSKTINQVLAFQQGIKSTGSSASGKYQFIQSTLRGLAKKGHVGMNQPFNKENQDKLAIQLLIGRGLNKYLAGNISLNTFAINLAKEWASMPVPVDGVKGAHRTLKAGQSYYAGDGLNKALVKVGPFLAAIKAIKA